MTFKDIDNEDFMDQVDEVKIEHRDQIYELIEKDLDEDIEAEVVSTLDQSLKQDITSLAQKSRLEEVEMAKDAAVAVVAEVDKQIIEQIK